MRPPTVYLLLLLLLLFSPSLARSPSARILALQRALSLSRRHTFCRSALRSLSSARRCRYANLSPRAYQRLRAICRTRSESRAALAACRTRPCLSQRARLRRALRACRRIGWDASGARADCPSIRRAKALLALARARDCPPPQPRSPRDVQAELDTVAENEARRLGLRESAYPLQVVESQRDVPDVVLILLHGAGQTNTEYVRSARQVVDEVRGVVVRVVLPQSPTRYIAIANITLSVWYDVKTLDLANGPWKEGEIRRAARNVDDLIRFQTDVLGVERERVIVAGFSQGGSVAATVYLRYKVAAAIMVSSFLPMRDAYPKEMTNDSAKAPVLMFQSEADNSLPVIVGTTSRDTLRDLGRDVRYVQYAEEGHGLQGEIEDVTKRAFVFASEVFGTDIARVQL